MGNCLIADLKGISKRNPTTKQGPNRPCFDLIRTTDLPETLLGKDGSGDLQRFQQAQLNPVQDPFLLQGNLVCLPAIWSIGCMTPALHKIQKWDKNGVMPFSSTASQRLGNGTAKAQPQRPGKVTKRRDTRGYER